MVLSIRQHILVNFLTLSLTPCSVVTIKPSLNLKEVDMRNVKRMFVLTGIFFLAVVSMGSAAVSNLTCTNNRTNVDAGLEQLSLGQDVTGRYSVTYLHVRFSRRRNGNPVTAAPVTLARNLECVFSKKDSRVVHCEGVTHNEENSRTAELSTQKVTRTGVESSTGKDVTTRLLEVSLSSSELEQAGYPETNEDGYAELKLKLSQCEAVEYAPMAEDE